MSLVIETPIPETGHVEVNCAFEIVVSAEDAKYIADDWVFDYVSNLTRAEDPTLIVTESGVVWRVPLVFSAPHVGRVGIVDTVDVDVRTGQMLDNDVEKTIEKGIALSETLPPYKPGRRTVPDEFIPKHIPPAEMLILPGDDV